MPHPLIGCLSPFLPAQVNWITADAPSANALNTLPVPLDPLPSDAVPSAITLLLPATAVTLCAAELPTRQSQRILQAIPYALEESLSSDIEDLHFAIGKRPSGNAPIPVAVVAHEWMNSCLVPFQQTGILPAQVTVDVLAVPLTADSWSILPLKDRVLVRSGIFSGFAIETPLLETMLQLALRECSAPPGSLTVYLADGETVPTVLHGTGIPVTTQTHAEGAAGWLAEGAKNAPLNLLQGRYQLRDSLREYWQPWRLTIALLLLLGTMFVAGEWLTYEQLRTQRHQLQMQMEALYRDLFPQTQRIIKPRVQLSQQLERLLEQQQDSGNKGEFLTLLTHITPFLQQIPKLTLQKLEFRGNRIDIGLEAGSLQAIERFRQQLNDSGLNVEILSVNSRDDGAEGRLRISL